MLAWRNLFILACLVTFNVCIGLFNSVIAPIYPKEARKRGIKSEVIGMVFAIYPLCLALTSPMTNFVTKQIGINFTLLSGIFLEGGLQILFGFLSKMESGSIYLTFSLVLRSLAGLSGGLSVTTCFAIVFDRFEGKSSFFFSLLTSAYTFGSVIGPPIGGILYSLGGFELPFFTLGSLQLVVFVTSWIAFNHDTQPQNGVSSRELSQWQVIKIPDVIIILVAVLIAGALNLCYEPILSYHLEVFSLSPAISGLVFLSQPLMGLLSGPLIGYIIPEKHYRLAIILAFLSHLVGCLLLGPSPILFRSLPRSLAMDCIGLAMLGLGFVPPGIFAATEMGKAVSKAGVPFDQDVTNIISGLWMSSATAGLIIGPAVSGILYQYLGFAWTMTAFASMALCTGVILIVNEIVKKAHKRPLRLQTEDSTLLLQGKSSTLYSEDAIETSIENDSIALP